MIKYIHGALKKLKLSFGPCAMFYHFNIKHEETLLLVVLIFSLFAFYGHNLKLHLFRGTLRLCESSENVSYYSTRKFCALSRYCFKTLNKWNLIV